MFPRSECSNGNGEPGSVFGPGSLLVEFETHEALVEVRAAQAAILRRLLAAAGDWVAIGGAIALLSDTEDEPLPDDLQDLGDMPVDFLID